MPTLRLRFPAGRYHATPWGHHVNEGLIEWPPSPWRLLRALIACGFASQHWTEIPPLARLLIEKLASTLPLYRLPEASAAHSRHFMPIGSFKKPSDKKKVTDFEFAATTTQHADLRNYYTEDTTLVFDTWANVGNDALTIHWDCDLTSDETRQFRELAESLGYLGRSESWVEAEMIVDEAARPDFNALPHRNGLHCGPGWEQVSLMAAIPPDDYASWRHQTTEKSQKELVSPESSRKSTAKQLEKLRLQRDAAAAPYPPDLLACLTKDTAWWKQYGWSQPPGSQRVLYLRRSDALQVGVPQRPAKPTVEPVTTMLLAITTPSGNRSALPACTRTLPQAELFHRAIVGRVANGQRVHCPELTGRDIEGRPLHEHHAHAHTLPVDLDSDGRIDHFIIHANMGLGEAAQRAIRTLRRTWTKGVVGDLQLALVGYGDLNILRQLPPPLNHRIERLLGPPKGVRVWESATPFVPPRFIKPRGRNTLPGQISAELASRQLPAIVRIDTLDETTRALRHYIRRRNHGGVQPFCDIGYGLRLTFVEPVQGPLALGYASHYGLGMFHAVDV